jgi:hypothetical protein
MGEIVGHRLVAVQQVARAVGRIHGFHGNEMAALGRARGDLHRQSVQELGYVFLVDIPRQLSIRKRAILGAM